jgi:cytosine/uracil/thiamine/allantoin permease
VPALKPLYSYAWFVGFLASGALYWALSLGREPVEIAAAAAQN